MNRATTLAAATAGLALLATAVVAATGANGPDGQGPGDLAIARSETAGYHRVATAEADGYGRPPSGPLHECIASLNPMMPGAMGYHYPNGPLLGDAVLDPATPEVLVYESRPNGKLKLAALEYVVFKDAWEAENGATIPELFGRRMTFVDAPNRYELPPFYQVHAWVWKNNPHGMHADHNPRVSCP